MVSLIIFIRTHLNIWLNCFCYWHNCYPYKLLLKKVNRNINLVQFLLLIMMCTLCFTVVESRGAIFKSSLLLKNWVRNLFPFFCPQEISAMVIKKFEIFKTDRKNNISRIFVSFFLFPVVRFLFRNKKLVALRSQKS